VPFFWISGNQSGPGMESRCYGPPWVMHVLAYMEQTTLERRVTDTLNARDFEEACPWDNIDGTPLRRPESDIQTTMRKFMPCPSAQQSEVMYNDLSTENLYKGNYAACFGGGAFIDATPHPQANRNLAGVFGVVTNVRKYPIGERIGAGKGTKIGNIPDGSSNT